MTRFQNGNGLPVFQGTRLQKGRGLGSIFSGLARVAIPLLKNTARHGAKEALRAGINVARDLSEGKSLKKSIKSRGIEAVKKTAKRTLEGYQKGSGKRIKHRHKGKSTTNPQTKIRRASLRSDIFGKYRKIGK